jgi:streptomycin 6-kinase
VIAVPPALRWWARVPGGEAWLERLPQLIADCVARWELELGEPYAAAFSYVARARRADGTPAVLKLNFPDAEGEHEATALRHWRGRGAVGVLADDPARRALLVERCAPGAQLPEAALDAVVPGLLRRLWAAPPPPPAGRFGTVTARAPHWAATIAGLGLEARLERRALAWLDELVGSAPEALLVNQDLHRFNILSHGDAWVVIDAKPIVGERAVDFVALGRNRPDPAWLTGLAAAAGVDPERARRWAVVHALAWAREGRRVLDDQVAAARALAA